MNEHSAIGSGRVNVPDTLQLSSESGLTDLLESFSVCELSLFGSAARGELTPDSDLDFLIEFENGKAPALSKFARLRDALSELFGNRKVDIVTRSVLKNPYRRQHIEKDLILIYTI